MPVTSSSKSSDVDRRETLRLQILNSELMYRQAIAWMTSTAEREGKLTYEEAGKLWHKNEEQLRNEYTESYLDFCLAS